MKKILKYMFALIFLISACGRSTPAGIQDSIEISVPYAHAAGAGETTAVYMVIKNNGTQADRLISASCDAAMMTQTMESSMEGDVMSMGDVPVIELPAGGTVELKPGGYHIMLMDLMKELKAGSTIRLTLEFEKAGKMTLEVPVLVIGAAP
ncbi:MAG: copper chaperone PCu(A)C [Chloroflexi bacterium]|nr:copper chaperone PCu(A)C [Chloroflexota bacterium]